MFKITFSCTSCGQRYDASPSHQGKTFPCTKCSAPLTVPTLDNPNKPLVDVKKLEKEAGVDMDGGGQVLRREATQYGMAPISEHATPAPRGRASDSSLFAKLNEASTSFAEQKAQREQAEAERIRAEAERLEAEARLAEAKARIEYAAAARAAANQTRHLAHEQKRAEAQKRRDEIAAKKREREEQRKAVIEAQRAEIQKKRDELAMKRQQVSGRMMAVPIQMPVMPAQPQQQVFIPAQGFPPGAIPPGYQLQQVQGFPPPAGFAPNVVVPQAPMPQPAPANPQHPQQGAPLTPPPASNAPRPGTGIHAKPGARVVAGKNKKGHKRHGQHGQPSQMNQAAQQQRLANQQAAAQAQAAASGSYVALVPVMPMYPGQAPYPMQGQPTQMLPQGQLPPGYVLQQPGQVMVPLPVGSAPGQPNTVTPTGQPVQFPQPKKKGKKKRRPLP
mgnify:CR=1 FL=1